MQHDTTDTKSDSDTEKAAEKKEYRKIDCEYGTIYPGFGELKTGGPSPLWMTMGQVTINQGEGKDEKTWKVTNTVPDGGIIITSEQGKQRRFRLDLESVLKLALKQGLDDDLPIPEEV